MKRSILFIILLHLFSMGLFATTVSPDYKAEGLGIISSLSYDNIFNSDYKCFTLDILGISIFPSSPIFTGRINYLAIQFSPDINIFDLFYGVGFTVYPFKKIFSFSGNFNWGLSLFLFNHFSYIADIKANLDIPIYEGHNISLGAGLRHRNSLKMINWLNLDDSYYEIYNSYFFEIGYRLIF